VRTFGVTEQAYIADVQHLNGPAGLFIDAANNLYVVEDQGNRVLKFNAAGNNLMSIGTAGLFVRGSYTFDLPRDAAVDNSGNLWVVDKHRAVQYSATGTYLQELPQNDPWQSGNDNTHFNEPYGITFDLAGRMFIADSQNHRVQVYTFSSAKPVYSATIGVTGVTGNDNAHFNTPYRLAVDSSGGLYVIDNRNNRVQRCVLSGAWACTTLDGGLNNPQGIAVDSNDNVYIADTGNYRIRKCMPGGVCSSFANLTNWTTDLAVDTNGTIYASTQSRHVIRKFSSAGNFSGTHLGAEGVPYLTDGYHYNHPRVAIDDDTNIIVLEENGQRLLKLDPTGALLWAVGEPGMSGDDNAHFNWPHGVAIGNDRRIYVADNCRVQIFSGNGSYITSLGTGCGTGDYQFGWATGIAVDDNNYIYVSDARNHRVQIYDNNRIFVGRIGVTGQCGTDNDHLCTPIGIEVDSSNNIYAADINNCRVQKFDRDRNYLMTVGVTRSCGDSLAEVSAEDVAVDAQGRIYVSGWNHRVQVFDATGAYLTTIGGAYGNKSSQFRGGSGVDVDRAGNVYVADFHNGRIQKFAPGVPGWRQVNINGFGERQTERIMTAETFQSQLYIGTRNYASGAQIWRTADNLTWTAVIAPGFGAAYGSTNPIIPDLVEFKGQIYAGVGSFANDGVPGQIWRSPDGVTWGLVDATGLGNPDNMLFASFASLNDVLYTVTRNSTDGLEIWRSNTGHSGDWTRTLGGGNGDVDNYNGNLFEYQGYLYVAVENTVDGLEIWRTNDGTAWARVITGGFGDSRNKEPSNIVSLGGYLYVGTNNAAGPQIWRSSNGTTWTQLVGDGFGDGNNTKINPLIAFNGVLYAGVYNGVTGVEVWRSTDGMMWSQVNADGFGDSNNTSTSGAIVFNSRLLMGSGNTANGGELWLYLSNRTYLPIVLRQ